MKHTLLVSAIALSFSTAAIANSGAAEQQSAVNVGSWNYELSLSYLSLDSEAALAQGLGDNGFALEFSGTYAFTPMFATSVGLAFANIDDNNSFSQEVRDQFNNVETVESSATAMPLFAEFYHRNRLNSDMEYRVGLGYATIVGASRDISNCINCFSSDFDLEGGGYLLAAMGKNVGEKSTVGLMARQYMSGDLDNSLVLWWRVNTNR